MNTERGLLFLALCLGCFWLVFDEFFGNKRISAMAAKMTPNIPSVGDAVSEFVDKQIEDPEEIIKGSEKAKDAIDKSKNDKDTKKHLKDAVDHFYDGRIPS